MADSLPGLDDVLAAAPSPPSTAALRELTAALAGGSAGPAVEHHRALNAAILAATTDSSSPAAATAAAACACVAVVSAAPRAYDTLVFETTVRKMVKFAADQAARTKGGSKKKGAKIKKTSKISLGPGLNGDDGDETELFEADCEAFWRALVKLAQAPSRAESLEGFAFSVAVALAGLLHTSTSSEQRELVAAGFGALMSPGVHGPLQEVVRACYGAFLSVAIAPKLPAATRNAVSGILLAIVAADEAEDTQQNPDDDVEDAHMSGTTPRAKASSSARRRRCENNEDFEQPLSDGSRRAATLPSQSTSTAKPSLTKQTSIAFIQKCCMRVPERAEDRAAMSTLVMKIVATLDSDHVEYFAMFVTKLALQARSLLRLFATELALALLPLAISTSSTLRHHAWLEPLVDMLVDRSSDKIPAVRAKAIACLASALESIVECSGKARDCSLPQLVESIAKRLVQSDFDIEARADDSKSGVRKAVVQLVSTLAYGAPTESSAAGAMFTQFAQVACSRCEDVVATVRRFAIQSLTTLVLTAYSSSSLSPTARETIMRFWMTGVLPRVVDSETSVQEGCLQSFSSLILERLAQSHSRTSSAGASPSTDDAIVNSFLAALCGGNGATGRYTATVLCMMTRSGSVDASIVNALQNLALNFSSKDSSDTVATDLERKYASGAWVLLAEIVEADEKSLYTKLLNGTTITESALEGSGGRQACRIAAAIATELSAADRARLGKQLYTALTDGVATPASTGSTKFGMDALPVMTRALASFDTECGDRVLACIDDGLAKHGSRWSDEQLMSCMAILGEVCASFELRREPPARLVSHIQALMESKQPERVRAMALAALGNMCICDVGTSAPSTRRSATGPGVGDVVSRRVGFGELLARRSISLFVRELNDGGSVAARVNALIVLCDLCRRYTSIVEPHLGRLAMCLRDDSGVVRQRALASLTSLLQEDYLKLRGGPVFFRLVLSLLDTIPGIQRSAEYVLSKVLLPKTPMLFATNLVEVIFVLNNCRVHSMYNQYLRTAEEAASNAKLSAAENDRFIAYHWIMARIPIEQRVGLSARLRQDILMPICDDVLNVGIVEVSQVATDALKLLCLPEMCLAIRSGAPKDGDDFGDGDDDLGALGSSSSQPSGADADANAASNRTKAKILAKVYELELKQETLPVLLDLKRWLEVRRSPLLAAVGQTLCTLLRPYRADLGTLIEDSTLSAEIEFDMKQEDATARKTRNDSRAAGKTDSAEKAVSEVTPARSDAPVTPLRDATNTGAPPRALSSQKTPSGAQTPPRTRTPARAQNPSCTRTPSRAQRPGSGVGDAECEPTGRLADTLAGSPRLSAQSRSTRKEREAIVFDMNNSSGQPLASGLAAAAEAGGRSTRASARLARTLAL